ncbi:hypothetical protein MRB53_006185 [Persea americana]|uniref:Uncharacterized protein n=1 Tax=Persea americana TaxID=3435 RepID=A0ACC2MFE8_PERAE|nr:hypothetical protein MRB53_006185 [Persea americana]
MFDSTVEPESHVQGTSMSSVASSSTRRGRGRSKNISLTWHIKDIGQKLRIEIPEGLSRPVGKYAKQFKTEVGIICRMYAPLARSTWPAVKQEQRQIIYDRILEKVIALQSQSTEADSTPLTDDEICKRVLGTRPGYVQGLVHGMMAPRSSSTSLHNNQGVEKLTKRATVAERQAQELVE